MPNDIANNMADTIRFLEEENARLTESHIDLQLAYNEQMIELREAKRLLKLAVEDFDFVMPSTDVCEVCEFAFGRCKGNPCKWRYADEAKRLLGNEI